MAASTLYVCDGCGAQKGTANHWYMLLLERRSMTLMTWECNPLAVPSALHYCGEACLLKKISERLGRASFAADAPPVVDDGPILEDEPVVTEVSDAKCVHCNGVDVVGTCTACKEPTCRSCQNWRCERIDRIVTARSA